jgi:hypothetical protein
MTTSDFRLKIDGPGINVDQPVTREVAQRVLLLMFGGEGQPPPKRGLGGDHPRREERDDDAEPHDFLGKHEANQIPEKIVALGVYMEERQDKDSFSREDLLKAFEDADESTPKNFPRDMKTTLKRKWIAEKRGAEGQFYTTKKGKQALAANFKAVRRRSPKRKKGKTT